MGDGRGVIRNFERQSQTGLTLVELLITLAVAAVVLTLGAPSLATLLKDSGLRQHAVSLHSAVIRGRTEALSRASFVTLCAATQDLNSCRTSGGDWSDGWLLFVDQGTPLQYDEGDTLLLVQGGDSQISVTADSGLGVALSFSAKGFAQSPSGTTAGRLIVCDDRRTSSKSRSVTINRLGSSVFSKTVSDAATACG